MTEQDVIAELHDDADLNRGFSREGQTDWARSIRRVAKAQSILWHETPINERLKLLARVDHEAVTK